MAATSFILSLATGGVWCEPVGSIPPEVRTALDRVFTLIYETPGKNADAFSNAMQLLANQIDDRLAEKMKANEGTTITAKLATIALDRQKRPEVYEEIKETYITPHLNPRLHALLSPPLRSSIHAIEKYRMAWEYYLLSPLPDEAVELADLRPIDALGHIASDASIVAILARYHMVGRQFGPDSKDSRDYIQRTYRRLTSSLQQIGSEKALHAMLEMLSFSKEAMRTSPGDWTTWDYKSGGSTTWDPEQDLLRTLTYSGNLAKREKWRKVIEAFPRDNLPPDQRALLEKVLEKK
jgi:hypothetical protein